MRYWDASALVPLIVSERETRRMSALHRSDRAIVTSWASVVECESAIARRARDGLSTQAAWVHIRQRLALLQRTWIEIAPLDRVRDTARRLLRVHSLRTVDAFQLAAAVEACEHRPDGFAFVCLDERLASAARAEGFFLVGAHD